MAEHHDDFLNDLNDFTAGMSKDLSEINRDGGKSDKVQKNGNNDSADDSLSALNDLGRALHERPKNESPSFGHGSSNFSPEDPEKALNDFAGHLLKGDNSVAKGANNGSESGVNKKGADKGLNDLSNALGHSGKPNFGKAAKGISELGSAGAFGSLNDLSGGALKSVKDANKNPAMDNEHHGHESQQRGTGFNVNPRNVHHTPWQRAKDLGHRAVQGLMNGAKDLVGKTAVGIKSGVFSLTGHTMTQAMAVKAAVTSLSLPLVAGGGIGIAAYTSYNHYQVLDASKGCAVANDNGSGFSEAGIGNDSEAHDKLAKHIFDSWVHLGTSGAAAAGITGHVSGEGGLTIPDKAEGCFANSKECEIAYGAQPAPDGPPGPDGHSGGGGVYQLTPYSEFALVGDKKWLDLDAQTKFMYEHKIGNKAHFKWFAHLTDPVEAADHWNDFESGTNTNLQAREATAKKYYEKFNGASISANDSLLGSASSKMADLNSAIAETVNNIVCSTKKGDNGPVSAGNWAKPYDGFTKGTLAPDQRFGPRSFGWHDGIDIGTSSHTGTIKAIHGGKVVHISCEGHTQNDLGYNIVVESPDGYSEVYQEFAFSMEDGRRVSKVKEGDTVKAGQPIAELSPSTPNVTHIHIGVYKGSAKELMGRGWKNSWTPIPEWIDPTTLIK